MGIPSSVSALLGMREALVARAASGAFPWKKANGRSGEPWSGWTSQLPRGLFLLLTESQEIGGAGKLGTENTGHEDDGGLLQ